MESPDSVVIIGVARLFLQPLAYLVEIRQPELMICDLRGVPIGAMDVTVLPCADESGAPVPEAELIETPEQLIGKKVLFDFLLAKCCALPSRFKVLKK